jgi:type IV conjugative transfer system coupling protein TraD
MSIIRGTQLIGHTVRMGGQSAREWILWVTIMWFTTFGVMSYLQVDKIHISHVVGEFQSMWYNISGRKNEYVALANRDATMTARSRYVRIMDHLKRKKEPRLEKQVIANYYQASQIRRQKLTDHELENMFEILLKLSWQSLLIGTGLAFGLFLIIAKRGGRTKKSNFIRGREITSSKDLNKKIVKGNRKEKIDDSYTIAGITYPPRGETEHLMLAGTTGTGKTIVIKDLLRQIKERGDKAIVYDYTGAFVEGYYDPAKDIIINPFDKRSKSWCLLNEVDDEAEFETIAEALIGGSDAIGDPFWPNGARLIFSELCKLQYRKGNLKTQDLYKHFSLPVKKLNKVLKNTLARNFTDPNSEKTTLSLLMLMTTYLQGLQYIENKNNDFSIKKWLLDREQNNILFLSSKSSLHSTVQPLISAMMDIAINNLGELPVGNKSKTWVIFDEVASLNYLPSLEKGLTVSRNFGGCFVIALQSISQLTRRYGPQDAETIASNCSSKIILKAGNNDTAKWASQLIGTQEIEEYREGLSYGAHEMRDGVNLSKHKSERTVALASEILSLPKFTGYALMTGGYPVAKIDFEKLKYQEPLFKNVNFEAKKIIEKSEGAEIQDNGDIKIEEGK